LRGSRKIVVGLSGKDFSGYFGSSVFPGSEHYWPPPVVGALITTQRVLVSGLP